MNAPLRLNFSESTGFTARAEVGCKVLIEARLDDSGAWPCGSGWSGRSGGVAVTAAESLTDSLSIWKSSRWEDTCANPSAIRNAKTKKTRHRFRTPRARNPCLAVGQDTQKLRDRAK